MLLKRERQQSKNNDAGDNEDDDVDGNGIHTYICMHINSQIFLIKKYCHEN